MPQSGYTSLFTSLGLNFFIFKMGLFVVVLVAQSCPTLCDSMDYSSPGSSVHGIFQASILEWIAFPPPGDLPYPGVEPGSPSLQMDSLLSEPPGSP